MANIPLSKANTDRLRGKLEQAESVVKESVNLVDEKIKELEEIKLTLLDTDEQKEKKLARIDGEIKFLQSRRDILFGKVVLLQDQLNDLISGFHIQEGETTKKVDEYLRTANIEINRFDQTKELLDGIYASLKDLMPEDNMDAVLASIVKDVPNATPQEKGKAIVEAKEVSEGVQRATLPVEGDIIVALAGLDRATKQMLVPDYVDGLLAGNAQRTLQLAEKQAILAAFGLEDLNYNQIDDRLAELSKAKTIVVNVEDGKVKITANYEGKESASKEAETVTKNVEQQEKPVPKWRLKLVSNGFDRWQRGFKGDADKFNDMVKKTLGLDSSVIANLDNPDNQRALYDAVRNYFDVDKANLWWGSTRKLERAYAEMTKPEADDKAVTEEFSSEEKEKKGNQVDEEKKVAKNTVDLDGTSNVFDGIKF